ncbi:hypothetical protein D3C76_1627310 [compost metagenome]
MVIILDRGLISFTRISFSVVFPLPVGPTVIQDKSDFGIKDNNLYMLEEKDLFSMSIFGTILFLLNFRITNAG